VHIRSVETGTEEAGLFMRNDKLLQRLERIRLRIAMRRLRLTLRWRRWWNRLRSTEVKGRHD
jgi:hypothetical protein